MYRIYLFYDTGANPCRIWIFFSGSVILFNKWVLDTAGFRNFSHITFSADLRIPNLLNDMAFSFRDYHDPDPRSNDKSSRWFKNRQNGWSNLSSSHCANRCILQLIAHILKPSLPLLVRRLHPNDQGIISFMNTL